MAGNATQKQIARVRTRQDDLDAGEAFATFDCWPESQSLRELCHDLLQPAAAISALVAAAQVESGLPPAAIERLNQVTQQARRIAELCRHTLDGDAGHAAVLLHELATEVAQAASLTFSSEVAVRVEPALVQGDATGLRRTLANLLDNAIRAAGAAGRVTVTVGTSGKRARVTIADSGGGFGCGGSGVAGLGLRIAARVANAHGGELTMGRSAELGGAEVTLWLPSTFSRPPTMTTDKEVGR